MRIAIPILIVVLTLGLVGLFEIKRRTWKIQLLRVDKGTGEEKPFAIPGIPGGEGTVLRIQFKAERR